MRAKDLMSHPTITCHVNDALDLVARRMWESGVGSIAVIKDDGRLTGIVTDRDALMACYRHGRSLHSLLVNIAMTTDVISIRGDEPIVQVARLMARHQLRRIPVVDDEDRPLGIVTLGDLALEAARPDSKLTRSAGAIAEALATISRAHHYLPAA